MKMEYIPKTVKLIALLAAISMVPNMFVIEPVSSSITGVQLPGSGDWEITSPTVVTDETIAFHGNIMVTSSLTLINTTLIIDCGYDGQYGIDVLSGGSLIITDEVGQPSEINSSNQYAYTFRARSGSDLELIGCEIHGCGYYSGQIDSSSGLFIETDDVTINGCMFSENYIGMIFGSTNDITIVQNQFDDNVCPTIIEENYYGVYLINSYGIEYNDAIITNNEIYDIYVDENSELSMLNCYPEQMNKGGPGQFEFNSNPVTSVFNANDYCEVKYNSSCKTSRYDGWTVSGNDYYANSYCVLRRGSTYQILTNVTMVATAYVNGATNITPPPLPLTYKNAGILGWTCRIEYPITPSDQTNLLTWSSGSYWITIPSDYPILYCTLNMGLLHQDNNIASLQKITIYLIFDLPPTSGSDVKTQLTPQARCEYLYNDDSATYIPANIDLAGPYWEDNGSNSYFYGGSSSTSGINFNKKAVYILACAAAYNEKLGFNAANKIKNFVNYLIHGNWEDATAKTQAVDVSLNYVTTTMAADPANNIIRAHPLNPDEGKANDALGLHSHDPTKNGMYGPNNWYYQCFDFTAISTALDRAIGLAARQTTGWKYDDVGVNKPINMHVWTEVWIPDGQESSGNKDYQWCVFDACGCTVNNGTIKDSDTSVYGSDTRHYYYSGLTNDFGKPSNVYIFFYTTDTQTSLYEVTSQYIKT